jgi:outer membrane protein TolC
VAQDSLVAEAARRNHAIVAAREQAAALHALERGAAWDALPEVDLFGTIGGKGLAGTGRDVVFGGDTLRSRIGGGFGDTWSQIGERKYPVWSVGVSVTLPIGMREGRGERDRLSAEAARAEAQVVLLERGLEELVRASHRELANGSARLSAAREGVDAAVEQVRIGVIEYRNGQTTAFELVRLGADLAAAQQRYSQALVRTARAAADLKRLTGGAYPEALSSSEGERGTR